MPPNEKGDPLIESNAPLSENSEPRTEETEPSKDKEDDTWWLIIVAIMIGISASDAEPQGPPRALTSQAEARAVFARHDSASGRIGGQSKLRYTHMVSESQAPTLKTVTETWTMTPNRVLTRMSIAGVGSMEIGYNGTIGWTTSPLTGPVLIEGGPLKLLAEQATGRGHLDALFKTLTVGRRTVVEGKDVVPVMFEGPEGVAGTFYFDGKTGLLHAIRMSEDAKTDSTMLTVFSDYKRVDGELFAMTTTIKGAGQSMVTRITTLNHKVIDTARFSPPEEIRKLLKRQ